MMSAQIIAFPKSERQLDLEDMKEFISSAKKMILSDITEEMHNYDGEEPQTRQQYLNICKQFLLTEDYMDMLCAILDAEFYESSEPDIQNIVNAYYSFPA